HADTLNMQDSILMRPSALVIFDNVRNMICLITAVYMHGKNSKLDAKTVFNHARAKLDTIVQKLSNPAPEALLSAPTKIEGRLKVSSNMDEKNFKAAVAKAREYILAGDIFQVVLSQRFTMDFDLPSFALYRSLRRLNPSPFLFHLRMGD